MFRPLHSVYCLCVNVYYCHRVSTKLQFDNNDNNNNNNNNNNFLGITANTHYDQVVAQFYFVKVYLTTFVVKQHANPQYSIDCSSIEHFSEGTRNAPLRWQCNAETCRSYHT
jgi:hypothetical protein